MSSKKHPADLSPYLDQDRSDGRFAEIQRHLELCPECREELLAQESLNGLFRSREFELDPSPFQWRRLKARIEETQHTPSWIEALRVRRLAWGALLSLVLAFCALSGWEYHKYSANQQWAAVKSYAESEHLRLADADNPFRSRSVEAVQNPFSRYQTLAGGDRNPFAIR